MLPVTTAAGLPTHLRPQIHQTQSAGTLDRQAHHWAVSSSVMLQRMCARRKVYVLLMRLQQRRCALASGLSANVCVCISGNVEVICNLSRPLGSPGGGGSVYYRPDLAHSPQQNQGRDSRSRKQSTGAARTEGARTNTCMHSCTGPALLALQQNPGAPLPQSRNQPVVGTVVEPGLGGGGGQTPTFTCTVAHNRPSTAALHHRPPGTETHLKPPEEARALSCPQQETPEHCNRVFAETSTPPP